jgi:hypothetical protein
MSFYKYPAAGGASSNASVGLAGSVAPTSATEVAGKSPSGKLVPFAVDESGNETPNLSPGAATSANQATEITALQAIQSQTNGAATAANQTTGNTSLATIAANTGTADTILSTIATNTTGAATAANQTSGNASLATIATNSGTQATAANQASGNTSLATIATNTSGASTAALQTSGNASLTTIATNSGTQATAANQTSGNTSLATIATNTSNTQGTVAAGAAATKADLTAGIYNSTLPTLTTGQQAALQSDSNGRLLVGSIASALPAGANLIGSTTSRTADGAGNLIGSQTNSTQISLNVRTAGRQIVSSALFRQVYSTTSVTTAAYTQVIASTPSITNEVEIFDSSGQTLTLAIGASGSEVNQIYIFPGGNGRVPLFIPGGTRVSIKAISANAVAGEIDINFYS